MRNVLREDDWTTIDEIISTRFETLRGKESLLELAAALGFRLTSCEFKDLCTENRVGVSILPQACAKFSFASETPRKEWMQHYSSRAQASTTGNIPAFFLDLERDDALCWWESFGNELLPNLAKVAIRLLIIVASAAAIERSWKQRAYVQDESLARLTIDNAADLVFANATTPLL